MGSTNRQTEDFVARHLRSLGFQVDRIETGNHRTPDFLVVDQSRRYLIEVKGKIPDPQILLRRREVLERGDIWEEEELLGYSNAVSGVVREACRQLAAFKASPVDFRLLWLHAGNRHPDDQLYRFRATLLGSVDLIDLQELPETARARPCFYFTFSEFFRLRGDLDGAFISTNHHGLLCVNTFSPRHRMLVASRLAQSSRSGICDPIEDEGRGEAYIADCDINRKDETRVLDYVKQKYNRPRLVPFEPKRSSATVLGP